MVSKEVLLWLLRKLVYVSAGAAVTAVAAPFLVGGPDFDLKVLTLSGVLGGVVAAVVGDIRRKVFPDVMQVVTGEDPRVDG